MDLLSTVIDLKMEKVNMAGLKANFRAEKVVMDELLRLVPKSPSGNGVGRNIDVTG
jgi:ubiquinone biosynthesis protein COQ9